MRVRWPRVCPTTLTKKERLIKKTFPPNIRAHLTTEVISMRQMSCAPCWVNRIIRHVGFIWLLDSWPGCYSTNVTLSIELEQEDDGRWLAEVPSLAGVMCYGADRDEAVARVQALALRVIAERLEHREAPAEFVNVTFQAA